MDDKNNTDANQDTLAGMGHNSEPQDISPIDPEVNDIVDLDFNEVVAKYGQAEYDQLQAMLLESQELKKNYPQRVITDPEGRAKAHDLALRANALKNALKTIRDSAKKPHYDKYSKIQKAFTEAIEKPETMTVGWMKGVSDYDALELAREAQEETDRLQAIADKEAQEEAERQEREENLRLENEELKRKLAEANAPKEETPPAKSETPPVKSETPPASPDTGGETTPQSATPPAQRDMLGDASPTPPAQAQSSAPPPQSAPPPKTPVKAAPVAKVEVELGANQEEVWSVESFDPSRVDINKLRDGYFGAGQILEALNRYAKTNKGKSVIDGVIFKREIKTKLGRSRAKRK